jgi:hypothetical protein
MKWHGHQAGEKWSISNDNQEGKYQLRIGGERLNFDSLREATNHLKQKQLDSSV